MVDVIEVNSAHREIAKLFECGGPFDVGKDPVGLGRFKRERNEPGESAGLVLQFPKLAEMIHPLSKRFDVAIEHRARAAAAHSVPGAMDINPFSGSFFPAADLIAHNGIENFGATTSDRTKTGFAQSFQCFADRHAKDSLRQMTNLDRGERLNMKLGVERAQPAQKIQVPLFLQGRMQSSYHVHLGDSKRKRVIHGGNDFVNRIFEGVFIALFGSKGTELAR